MRAFRIAFRMFRCILDALGYLVLPLLTRSVLRVAGSFRVFLCVIQLESVFLRRGMEIFHFPAIHLEANYKYVSSLKFAKCEEKSGIFSAENWIRTPRSEIIHGECIRDEKNDNILPFKGRPDVGRGKI